MNVGILGFAHVHVHSYIERWQASEEMDICVTSGWDHDADRLAGAAGRFGIEPCESPEALLAGDVEVAVKGIGIEAVMGDVTGDGELNVLDVVAIVNIVLGKIEPTEPQLWAADMDGNGTVNILDALALILMIFGLGR